jgi:hypothetical protein
VPKKLSPWRVAYDLQPHDFAFFISHVNEDAAEVAELKAAIQGASGRGRRSLDCFLDKHNWELGNPNKRVIRDNLMKSDHLLLWVTPAFLRSRRGWTWLELAYAELIEEQLNFGKAYNLMFIVPVFRSVKLTQVQRTPLLDYWQRQIFAPKEAVPLRQIAARLFEFHRQEADKRAMR